MEEHGWRAWQKEDSGNPAEAVDTMLYSVPLMEATYYGKDAPPVKIVRSSFVSKVTSFAAMKPNKSTLTFTNFCVP